jgi:pimeloyl-ACP methyl ester carboxylesterase
MMHSHKGAVTTCMALLGSLLCSALSEAMAGQYVRVSDDLELYYEDVGQGQPLLLVPGWTASGVVFSKQIEHFSKTHRVITFDPRSQGLSTRTLEHNDYAQHGRDLAAFIDKLGLKRVVLVAWSAACYDAYSYVRQVGIDNLAAFVCIDQAPRGLSPDPDDWALNAATEQGLGDVRKRMDAIANNRGSWAQGLAKAMNAQPLSAEDADWFVRQSMLSPTYAVLLLRADMMLVDYRVEAKQIDGKLPVLNVISEPSVAKAMPWIKANTPNSATFTIKRHMSFWSESDSFNAGLEAFLAKVKS